MPWWGWVLAWLASLWTKRWADWTLADSVGLLAFLFVAWLLASLLAACVQAWREAWREAGAEMERREE